MVQQAIPDSNLVYFLAEKNRCLIVTLIGKLGRKNVRAFEACMKDIAQSDAKWIIINFRDIEPVIDEPLYALLAILQKNIRAKPAALKVCSFHPELRKILTFRGLIRHEEMNNNLTEALMALNSIEKSVA